MKKNLLKAAAVVFACAVTGIIGCMGSSGGSGCGGSVPATTTSLTCGKGTYQVNGQCVADPNSGSSSSSNSPSQAPTTTTQSVRR